MSDLQAVIDPQWFRQVLGQYPTGVCVITALGEDGALTGMVVGSFTSVSLDPPLVAFFPERKSSSWARLKGASRFCVNILSCEQEPLCRKLASKDPDKFAALGHRLSAGGSPILDGVVAWIDCDLYSIEEAGDHDIVLGRIRELDVADGGLPLLFFQGGYGRFAPSSLMASDTHGLLTEQLRMIDRARPVMESLAAELSAQCVATTRLGDELIVAASAGKANPHGLGVGTRLPFAPPLGSTFAAWLPDAEIDRWIGARLEPGRRESYRAALAAVRERGFAVALLRQNALRNYWAAVEDHGEPAGPDHQRLLESLAVDPSTISAEVDDSVRMITAPVFDAAGRATLALAIQDFAQPLDEAQAARCVERLLAGTRKITELLGGRAP